MLIDFKPIPEYPQYLVSTTGEVWSTKSNKTLKQRPNTRGYLQFQVSENNKQKFILTSRAVARVWCGLPSLDSPLEVDHKDTNKLNNHYTNLNVLDKAQHAQKTREDNGYSQHNTICQCGREKSGRAVHCKKCVTSSIKAEDIVYWVCTHSWVRAQKELGLSDNGLRKRYKALTGKDPKNIKEDQSNGMAASC